MTPNQGSLSNLYTLIDDGQSPLLQYCLHAAYLKGTVIPQCLVDLVHSHASHKDAAMTLYDRLEANDTLITPPTLDTRASIFVLSCHVRASQEGRILHNAIIVDSLDDWIAQYGNAKPAPNRVAWDYADPLVNLYKRFVAYTQTLRTSYVWQSHTSRRRSKRAELRVLAGQQLVFKWKDNRRYRDLFLYFIRLHQGTAFEQRILLSPDKSEHRMSSWIRQYLANYFRWQVNPTFLGIDADSWLIGYTL